MTIVYSDTKIDIQIFRLITAVATACTLRIRHLNLYVDKIKQYDVYVPKVRCNVHIYRALCDGR